MGQPTTYLFSGLNEDGSSPAISSHVFNTGAWSPTEDERLSAAVVKHGTRWTSVAADVSTHNGEQCAKRWNDHVNSVLDHGPWSVEEDKTMLDLVAIHGHNWKLMAETCHKSRFALVHQEQTRTPCAASETV
ncbi:hypothetical protein PG996_004785 [Apiospora saccharicola]|uniref:Myb-like domain-containing protein n=1 Tax=Apiospora saccharicola TaxID=335842 RepID=A0ABR1W562_9PEZI